MLLLLITLIVLRATSGGVSIISFTSVVGAPVGIGSARFTLIFFSNNRNNQKITKNNKKKQRKSMINFLCLLKVNSIALKI